MPLNTSVANALYSGSWTMESENQVNVWAEVNAVRAIPVNQGYASISWSAGIFIQPGTTNYVRWDEEMCKPIYSFGCYEILYGEYLMARFPIDELRIGTQKVDGHTDGGTVNIPGFIHPNGNGSTISTVNIGAGRPLRGDTIRWYLRQGCTGVLRIAVSTSFVDNVGNTNKYFMHS